MRRAVVMMIVLATPYAAVALRAAQARPATSSSSLAQRIHVDFGQPGQPSPRPAPTPPLPVARESGASAGAIDCAMVKQVAPTNDGMRRVTSPAGTGGSIRVLSTTSCK